MKIIILALFLFSTVSCIVKDDKTQFPGERSKFSGKKARVTPTIENASGTASTPSPTQTTPSTTTEALFFPFQFNSHHSSILLKSSDHQKISFSAEPSNFPLSLVAGFSGTVSLNTRNGIHYLSLTPRQGNSILHFELSETGTAVKTTNQAQVRQKQILMESNKPILFYITNNSELSLLCLDTSQLEKVFTVKKELPKASECL